MIDLTPNLARALATIGYMNPAELTYLAGLAAHSTLVAEVGTYQGRSARAWVDNTPGTLFCVDTWRDGGEQDWDRNLADCPNVVKVKMDSCRAAAVLAQAGMKFDCCFLDAGHNYDEIHADILAWRPLLREGGILCGHDYQPEFPGVIRAVEELVPNFRLVPGTSIWTTEQVEGQPLLDPVHIVAIAKNEAPYLKEWIEFHQLVGVSHFTIYDNNSTGGVGGTGGIDGTGAVLAPYVERGLVTLIPWPMPSPCQIAAYADALNRYQGQPLWLAFLDIDEFLFSPRFPTIPEALAVVCVYHPGARSAIGVSWACFGNSGRQRYSPEPVVERFTWRLADSAPVNQHIKSVIWMGGGPGEAGEANEAGRTGEAGRAGEPVRVGGDPHFFSVPGGTWNELGQPILGPHSPHTSTLLRLNHYVTKSDEELIGKLSRGRADVVDPYQAAMFAGYHAREVEERGPDSIQRCLPELKERLANKEITNG